MTVLDFPEIISADATPEAELVDPAALLRVSQVAQAAAAHVAESPEALAAAVDCYEQIAALYLRSVPSGVSTAGIALAAQPEAGALRFQFHTLAASSDASLNGVHFAAQWNAALQDGVPVESPSEGGAGTYI